MRPKHYLFTSTFLVVLLIIGNSCIDHDYDLTKNIDLTISVGGSEFAIPGGKTEEIKLSKILKVEEGDLVKIDPATGNYYLLQTGDPSTTLVDIPGFNIPKPSISPIERELSFDNTSMRVAGRELTANIGDNAKTSFQLTATLPKEIISLSQVYLDANLSIRMSFNSNAVNKLNLKKITFNLPHYVVSTDLVDGSKVIENQILNKGGSFVTNIIIQSLLITPDKLIGNPDGTLSLIIEGEIVLSGTVSINEDDISAGTTTVSASLATDITFENIDPTSVTGVVNPEINVNIAPVQLNDLPDYLSNEEVKLDITNPMVLFDINNETPVAATIKGNLVSTYQGNYNDVTVPFAIPEIKGEANQAFCLSPINPSLNNTQWIEVSTLPSLITRIPHEIQVDVKANAIQKETTIALNTDYTITTNYSVNVPFAFGDKMTIVYTDTMSGWHEDIKKYSVKKIIATGYAINKIPLNLNLTAVAVRVNSTGELEELPGVTATVKVEGVENNIIPSGDITAGTKVPVKVEITDVTPGAIKQLDGLILNAVADSKGVNEGILNENQTFQLTDVRLKVPGGLTIDLND